jgi:small nuclear ribonucleoprotein (snRNP)-like protein
MTTDHSLPEGIVIENKNRIIELLKSTEREGIDNLIAFMQSPECNFFEAPASSKFHLCKKGGLAQHVLNVYDALLYLEEKYSQIKFKDSLAIIGILHDFDKSLNLYREKYTKAGARSQNPYEKEDLFPMGHGEKSVILLQKFIPLTTQEMMCIRWHMGPYDPSYRMYESAIKGKCPEAFIVYFADHLATLYVDDAETPLYITETIPSITEVVT